MSKNGEDEAGRQVDVRHAVADEFRHRAPEPEADDAGAVALSDEANAAGLFESR